MTNRSNRFHNRRRRRPLRGDHERAAHRAARVKARARKALCHHRPVMKPVLRIIREFQELSQNQLAQLTGIRQATISAIENDRVRLGVERAKILARALKCHPGVLVFPGWELPRNAAA